MSRTTSSAALWANPTRPLGRRREPSGIRHWAVVVACCCVVNCCARVPLAAAQPGPGALERHSAVFDSLGLRMIVFGGARNFAWPKPGTNP